MIALKDAPEFRVTLRVKNNRLIRAREARGLTQTQVATAAGCPATTISRMEALSYRPYSTKGEWLPTALKLAAYYGCAPVDLWPEAVLSIVERVVTVEATSAQILRLAGSGKKLMLLEEPTVEDVLVAKQRTAFLTALLATLPERTRDILLAVMDGEPYKDIGERYQISRERVAQIRETALHLCRRNMPRGAYEVLT
jgi:transcriptional regulator with XRE-family HTH domain